ARIGNGTRPGDLPVLGATTLRFASVDLRDRLPGLALGATSLTLPKAGGTASLDSVGQYNGTGFRLTGGVGVPAHPDGKVSIPIDLTAATTKNGGSVALKGAMTLDALQFAGLETSAVMTADALAALRPMLGAGLPTLTDVRFEGQVSVPPGAGPVRLRKVDLTTEQGDIAGDGTVELDATPVITGHWNSKQLDLDAMLSAFGVDLSGSGPGATTGPMIPNTRLPWATLRGPTVDVTLAVDAMEFQGETWRDVQATVSLKRGRLQASPVSVAMPAARMQAAVTLDAAGSASVAVTAPAVPWALVARYAGVPGPVSGTVAVSAQLRAQGQSMREMATTLTGPFSMTARDGQLSNRALVGMTAPALEALGITVPAAGQTRLACFGLIGTFAAGVGTLKTIALETSYLSLEGAGQVDLGRETVALKLQPMAQVVGSPVSVPVVVQGPFRNVSGALAADGLDKLGFLIDGLFGGDRSTACAAVPR
ncbi:MAG: AsmA-like C-terminal region-containing protein, partial [Janthinobacterium lividum]